MICILPMCVCVCVCFAKHYLANAIDQMLQTTLIRYNNSIEPNLTHTHYCWDTIEYWTLRRTQCNNASFKALKPTLNVA